jgi:hypothetical protein
MKKNFKLLEKGVWLPISVAAHLRGISGQTVRILYLSGKVKGIKFPVGPILVRLKDVPYKKDLEARGRPQES